MITEHEKNLMQKAVSVKDVETFAAFLKYFSGLVAAKTSATAKELHYVTTTAYRDYTDLMKNDVMDFYLPPDTSEKKFTGV